MKTTEYINAIDAFFKANARENNAAAAKVPGKVFAEMAEKTALETFHTAAKTVPAYKDFLKKNKVDSGKIKTIEDFKTLPLTGKNNYLSKYPLKDLLIGGNWRDRFATTSSSGSSGNPRYWPRFFAQDAGVLNGMDATYVELFDIDKKSTLFVNSAGMGVWTAGDMVDLADKFMAMKYGNHTSISPGIDMDNTLWSLGALAADFEQVIICGYPPFLKDLVDQLPQEIAKKTDIKIIAFGEPFSESWRNYIAKKLGIKKPYKSICSLLGSSEGGLIGSEFAMSVYIRQVAQTSTKLTESLFGRNHLPSLVQYGPKSKYIEDVGGQLVMTNKGALPLVRYDTKDAGGLLSPEDIASKYQEVIGRNLNDDLAKEGIVPNNMPYVYLFGRADYSATLYGVTISPEQVKDALISDRINKLLTSRFNMRTVYDKSENQNLEIVCELRRGVQVDSVDAQSLAGIVGEELAHFSTEYGKLLSTMKERVLPVIKLKEYGDKQYFSSKNKQKYLG
ncbi:MAG TPA: hypothetical protein PLC05_01340 [bacterium]|nr:hypothetical protein [bacterium]HOR57089.1 hypothetical protein [bacterium]HPL56128.1 hypothetical protein [bacterium]